jgi:hypothetical protein
MKKLTIYESHDGQRWETQKECEAWETLLDLLKTLSVETNQFHSSRLYNALKAYHPCRTSK